MLISVPAGRASRSTPDWTRFPLHFGSPPLNSDRSGSQAGSCGPPFLAVSRWYKASGISSIKAGWHSLILRQSHRRRWQACWNSSLPEALSEIASMISEMRSFGVPWSLGYSTALPGEPKTAQRKAPGGGGAIAVRQIGEFMRVSKGGRRRPYLPSIPR